MGLAKMRPVSWHGGAIGQRSRYSVSFPISSVQFSSHVQGVVLKASLRIESQIRT